MFFGVNLLLVAHLTHMSNYFSHILPSAETDPVGIFDKKIKKVYDYIVVGAGSAGNIIATRLSEDPEVNVLLLEAGKSDRINEIIRIPLLFASVAKRKFNLTWDSWSTRQKHALYAQNGERSRIIRGKVLGGTDAMSGMHVSRGNRHDYEEWVNEGCMGWGYDDLLHYFKKIENIQIPELRKSRLFGKHGPLQVRSGEATELNFFHKLAARELGIACNPSCNCQDQLGFCPMHITSSDKGKRCNSATNYLRPALERPNLQVSLNSLVTKVLIRNGVAIGVEMYKDGRLHEIYARREVILSAGVVGSPQILMRSGIGPRKHLESHGIYVFSDLPVGEDVQTQMRLILQYSINSTLNINDKNAFSEKPILDYLFYGKGIFTTNGGDGNIFLKFKHPHSHQQYADAQLTLTGFAYQKAQIKTLNFKPKVAKEHLKRSSPHGFEGIIWLLHPRSRGTVRLASADPFAEPLIDVNVLSEQSDVNKFVLAVREVRKLEKTKAWRSIRAEHVRHDTKGHCSEIPYDSDAYWSCMVRHFGIVGSISGTCRLGKTDDPSAVVDLYLRVKGIKDLRVADGSVIRNLISGPENAAIMMVAERVSDMIKQDRHLQDAQKGNHFH